MKKDHLAESTIKVTDRRLRLIAKTLNLDNPEEILDYLARLTVKDSYKESLANAYNRYARYNGIVWKKPFIKRFSQPPYVPTTEEINILIANAGKTYALILSILRDTGMRPIEIERLQLKWLDLNRGAINVQTAKHGNGRTLQLKSQTLAMLKEYTEKSNFNLNDHLFAKVDTIRSVYRKTRKRTATKLKKPELLRISLYSFRHYFATMLYHKTKSILVVKQQLGHKRIENTLIYTHLIKFSDDEFITATAKTPEQACKLIEQGFTKADEFNGIHIYQKPKFNS